MVDFPPLWASFSAQLEGLSLPASFFPQVEVYLAGLSDINTSLNLISFSTEEELRGHVVDSLQMLRAGPLSGPLRLVDVGTGGGLPGVPLAISRHDWNVTLLDSTRKKQSAVSVLLERAQISNAVALWGRAEELAHLVEYRESFDGALCRAVGRFSTVLELTLPLLKVGGSAFLHRGFDGCDELAEAGKALAELGGRPGPIFSYKIPGMEKERHIICVEKARQTSINYPRRAGIPAKKPL
ncbi:MAG: 16S rRNA (guanine(527)-N(7))-methyltransferase RsmG [Elusimicrobia bacterium]|nr:16S rRNA (guanine(527)-N(7))-methyltransferase RsmG [Elusimicrobiota bacterium]